MYVHTDAHTRSPAGIFRLGFKIRRIRYQNQISALSDDRHGAEIDARRLGWICGAKSPKLNDELIFTLSTGSNWMNYQSCCKTGSDLLDPCHCTKKKKARISQYWAKSGDVIEIFLHLFSCCRECETLRRQSAMVRARASRVSGLRRYLSTDLQQCSTSKLCTLAHRTAK